MKNLLNLYNEIFSTCSNDEDALVSSYVVCHIGPKLVPNISQYKFNMRFHFFLDFDFIDVLTRTNPAQTE